MNSVNRFILSTSPLPQFLRFIISPATIDLLHLLDSSHLFSSPFPHTSTMVYIAVTISTFVEPSHDVTTGDTQNLTIEENSDDKKEGTMIGRHDRDW